MSSPQEKNRELLLDVQSPLPKVNITNLSFAQRKIFDSAAQIVVGLTLAWTSFQSLSKDISSFYNRMSKGQVNHE